MDPVEMMVVMDGEFTKKEIKQIMRKVKRKLNPEPSQGENSRLLEEITEFETPKKKRKKTVDKEHCDLKSDDKSERKIKGGKTKLNSRLRRILKSKEKRISTINIDKSTTTTSSHNDLDEIESVSEHSGNDSVTSEYSTTTSDSGVSLHEDINSRIVALDCEFVGVGEPQRSALGRVSVLDYSGETLCDIYVKPEEAIVDYRTPWSGLRPGDMVHAVPSESARNTVKKILKGKIVVGHAVHNDFRVLGIRHPRHAIRDTAKCSHLRNLAGVEGSTTSLKTLSEKLLGRCIQNGEHCSVEDSQAALDLYKLVQDKWEKDISQSQSSADVADHHRDRSCDHTVTSCDQSRDELVTMDTECCDNWDSYLDDEYWPDNL